MTNTILAFMYVLFVTPIASGQEENCTMTNGSWLGEIEMGGTPFRLVFHIAADGNETLTGTVNSPDKRIEGIPLSRVVSNRDSVVFEVSAAQAKYEGRYSSDTTSIEGVWREGESTFPLILTCTTEDVQLADLPSAVNVNGVTLEVERESRHFTFFSTPGDRNVLEKIENVLENSYVRITTNLGTQFSDKIRVYVYPSIDLFHAGIYQPAAADWLVGAAGIRELKIVTPLNPGSVHTYESIMQAVVHEFVHASVMNLRGGRGLIGLPRWLNEGYAFHEADQMTDGMREAAIVEYRSRNAPTWSELADPTADEFANLNGYALSATIVEFLLDSYGRQKLIHLLRTPEDIATIYGVPGTELERLWAEYLIEQ